MRSLQKQRSRILEDINGSRPLSSADEDHRDGGFQLTEPRAGARSPTGQPRKMPPPRRLVLEAIPARSGPPLGTIYAATESAYAG